MRETCAACVSYVWRQSYTDGSFRHAALLCNDQATLDVLVSKQRQVINRLVAELGEFTRKHDYRFRHEVISNEIDSWQRATEMVVGGKVKTS